MRAIITGFFNMLINTVQDCIRANDEFELFKPLNGKRPNVWVEDKSTTVPGVDMGYLSGVTVQVGRTEHWFNTEIDEYGIRFEVGVYADPQIRNLWNVISLSK